MPQSCLTFSENNAVVQLHNSNSAMFDGWTLNLIFQEAVSSLWPTAPWLPCNPLLAHLHTGMPRSIDVQSTKACVTQSNQSNHMDVQVEQGHTSLAFQSLLIFPFPMFYGSLHISMHRYSGICNGTSRQCAQFLERPCQPVQPSTRPSQSPWSVWN